MKILQALVLVAAATVTVVSAQGPCMTCLQNALTALPLCKGLNITMGELEPAADPALVKCLCSSLGGAWIDGCTGSTQCGQDILSFKKAYAGNLQSAGLSCGATPTFIPAPSA
ncbi:hypothetical protein BGZ65_008906 [Modicella reniformis]|uniref:Uncharacterized protein n=1 Tax=Modicella reniformis TaxID=1440133 RepID=A0A9P6SVI9_9FUNG|nr:hypothetical protein BGZ65_008906 [Modicella reniformis]